MIGQSHLCQPVQLSAHRGVEVSGDQLVGMAWPSPQPGNLGERRGGPGRCCDIEAAMGPV